MSPPSTFLEEAATGKKKYREPEPLNLFRLSQSWQKTLKTGPFCKGAGVESWEPVKKGTGSQTLERWIFKRMME